MEFILFVLIVVLWKWWAIPLLSLIRFLPDSFFTTDSTSSSTPTTRHIYQPRDPYSDSAPDLLDDLPFITKWNVNQFMSADYKAAYLRSIEWQELRKAVLYRDSYACKVCGVTHQLEVHHITYERLGKEELSDLVTICRKHHQQLHDLLGYDRTTIFDISTLRKP